MTADLLAEPAIDAAGLAALDRPVLCVYGSTSPFRSRADRLAAALPDVRVVELEGGHLLPLECPAEVVGVVEEFLGVPASIISVGPGREQTLLG